MSKNIIGKQQNWCCIDFQNKPIKSWVHIWAKHESQAQFLFARWRRISTILLPKCLLEIDITIIPSHSVGTLGHILDTFDYAPIESVSPIKKLKTPLKYIERAVVRFSALTLLMESVYRKIQIPPWKGDSVTTCAAYYLKPLKNDFERMIW